MDISGGQNAGTNESPNVVADASEKLFLINGRYYALINTVAGKTLVEVCGPEDMPTGSQSEIEKAIETRFGSQLPDGEVTLLDLAKLILQKLNGVSAVIGS